MCPHRFIVQGKFLDNGSCGYVLRPDYMFVDGDVPTEPECLARLGVQPLDLRIRLIGARHLLGPRNRRGLVSPFVELEVVGADYDHVRLRTKVINDNGLNPVWDEAFSVKILNPPMALIRWGS